MFAFAASLALAVATLLAPAAVEYAPADAPAQINPFAGMTAAECGDLPDYQSTKDCVTALWDMGTLDLEPCAAEDTADCVWITRWEDGLSFIDVNGFAYYLPQVLEA